jgi:alpha-L-rhamnosidase
MKFVLFSVAVLSLRKGDATTTAAISATSRRDPAIEPYLYLNNGGFTGAAVASSPDPLVAFQWTPLANLTALQLFDLLPRTVELTSLTSPAAFLNLSSLVSSSPAVLAVGPGGFVVDFSVESAAWIEVDLASLPSASDLSLLRVGFSEWFEPLQNKWREPIVYPNGDAFTLRLETNSELYEGVRYGYFNLSGAVSSPMIITAMRAVCQAKPVNYVGSFFSVSNPLLERIWWTAVYSVRVNIQETYFGAVLVDRGDRYAWVGDLHPTQATDMVAFDNTRFVLQSIQQTKSLCNGIETYCIYWCLSVVDYFTQTGDTVSVLALRVDVDAKLHHAHDIFFNLQDQWEFVGWDDRVGGGFSNASVTESQWLYRFLVLRAWSLWADVNVALGNQTAANFWTDTSANASNFIRLQLGNWTTPGILGVHAAAEALAAPGFANDDEQQFLLNNQLNDATSICSLSNFNSYFVLGALGHGGALDKAASVVERCWGVEIALGATCFWEVSDPEWPVFMRKEVGGGPSVAPWGYNGNTSLCHPWSSGVAAFISRFLLGVTAAQPGYRSVLISPHIMVEGYHLAGSVPTPHGTVDISIDSTHLNFSIPHGCKEGARVELSEIFFARLGWIKEGDVGRSWFFDVSVSRESDGETTMEHLRLAPVGKKNGPRNVNGQRSDCAQLLMKSGERISISRSSADDFNASCLFSRTMSILSGVSFPPIHWKADVVEIDTWTQGSWVGKYGSLGYSLFNFDVLAGDVTLLPTFVSTLSIMDGDSGNWTTPSPKFDPRALDDPRNASAIRAIGYYECFQNQLPQFTFSIDIALSTEAEGVTPYQLAVYFVDYDIGENTHTGAAEPRRMIIDVKSGWPSLNPLAPSTFLPDTRGGVWVVVQLNQSVRIRVSQLPGATAVASAVAFDSVQ